MFSSFYLFTIAFLFDANQVFGTIWNHTSHKTGEVTYADLKAPMVTQHRGSLEVTWQELRKIDGSVANGRGEEQYLVRWKTKMEGSFHNSPLLEERKFKIGNFKSGKDYVIQVVAVVQEKSGSGDVFLREIKYPTTNFAPKNSQNRPSSRPNQRLRTTEKPNQTNTTGMDEEEVGVIECRSGQNEFIGFKKRSCVTPDDKRHQDDILKFVFGDGDSVFITIFASIFAALGIILNMLVLVSVLNFPTTRRNPATPFILSITFSDLVYSSFILPIMAMRFHHKVAVLSDTMCQIYPVVYYTVQGASLFSLTLVTLNRAAMLFLPTKVEKIFTNRKEVAGRNVPVNSILLLLICWAIPFFGLLPTIVGKNGCLGLQRHTLSCTILADSEGHSPKTMMYSVVFTVPTITIIATDLAIYFKMKEMQKEAKRMSVRAENERRVEKRFMMMLAAIFFVYVITYIPGFFVKMMDQCYTHPTLHAVAYVFNWASVWINPVIYIAAQKKYQDALRYLLPCMSNGQRTPTIKMKSFNLDSTGTSNSGSRRNTAVEDPEEVETRDGGSPSMVDKYMSRLRDRLSGRERDSAQQDSGFSSDSLTR